MLCIGNVNVSFNWGTVNQRSDKRRIGRANYCGGEKFAAELACAPHPNPLPGGARGLIVLGVRWSASFSNARKPLCTVSNAARFSPSPLWGERRGEGAARTMPHISPAMQENHYARYQMQHVFPPRPFGERVGVRGQRARCPTPARQCKKTIMHGIRCRTFSPSPFWGEGRGEGISAHVASS